MLGNIFHSMILWFQFSVFQNTLLLCVRGYATNTAPDVWHFVSRQSKKYLDCWKFDWLKPKSNTWIRASCLRRVIMKMGVIQIPNTDCSTVNLDSQSRRSQIVCWVFASSLRHEVLTSVTAKLVRILFPCAISLVTSATLLNAEKILVWWADLIYGITTPNPGSLTFAEIIIFHTGFS